MFYNKVQNNVLELNIDIKHSEKRVKMMRNLKNLIEKSQKLKAFWSVSDGALYKMCKEYPLHKNASETVSKLFLIGRSYAAAIERGVQLKKGESIYEDRIPKIFEKEKYGKKIDDALKNITEHKDLYKIFFAYNLTLEFFSKISGKSNKSLASKYLHFHKPDTFFIMDSRAKNAISDVLATLALPAKLNSNDLEPYRKFNESNEYILFYLKCLKCIETIKEKYEISLSTKEFDCLLLTVYEEKKTQSH